MLLWRTYMQIVYIYAEVLTGLLQAICTSCNLSIVMGVDTTGTQKYCSCEHCAGPVIM